MFRRGLLFLLSALMILGYFASGRAVSAEQPTLVPTEFPLVVKVMKSANVRAGPGTEYAIISSARPGQRLSVLGCNLDCSWYRLANDCWIAAFLVKPEQPIAPSVGDVRFPSDDVRLPTVIVSIPITVSNTVTQPTRCPQTFAAVNTYAGPGTFYAVAETFPAGVCIAAVGRNSNGDWVQLSHGMWILSAAILYAEPVELLPITDRIYTATPVPPPTPLPTATPTLVPTATPDLSEIITVGQWVVASQEQKIASALIWTQQFVDSGMAVGDIAEFSIELCTCVENSLQGSAEILGAAYPIRNIVNACALSLSR